MKRVFLVLLATIVLWSGCSDSGLATPRAFTRAYADALRKAHPGLKVKIVRDLELRITTSDGRESTAFLDNAYDTYKQAPSEMADVIQRFVAATVEDVTAVHDDIDRTRIVPVIKDRPWLDEIRETLRTQGSKEVAEQVFEELCPGLIVLYAEDTPKNIRYLTQPNLDKAKIERSELRVLACANLKRLLPKTERHGANGLYMITAGGTYEASLLLIDSIWRDLEKEVSGDVVVAIPTRDLLLVTGSNYPEGIERVRQMVTKASGNGSYRLTTKLFVYRSGKFSEFSETQETGTAPSPPQQKS